MVAAHGGQEIKLISLRLNDQFGENIDLEKWGEDTFIT